MKICPKCNSLAAYDPYFGTVVCRYCYWMEKESISEKDGDCEAIPSTSTKEAVTDQEELV